MAIEIVDFPSYKMVIFHSYVNVYQRVSPFPIYSLLSLLYGNQIIKHGKDIFHHLVRRCSQLETSK